MSWWSLSTNRMTVVIEVEDGIVVTGPPVVRKFIGQPSKNLARWLYKQGGYQIARLTDKEDCP
jgi:hypothetical protein